MSSTRVTPSQLDVPSRQFLDVRAFTRGLIQRQSWFIAFIVIDVLLVYAISTSPVLIETWNYIVPGISATMQMTMVSFLFAMLFGLIAAFGRISKNIIIYNLSTFYVEIFRGLPLLVIILIFAFVITPGFVDWITGAGDEQAAAPAAPNVPFLDNLLQRMVGVPEENIDTTTLRTRDIDPMWRIMFAFALTYGAFMTEVFRAGIESIGRGQMEAARSLGMTYLQAMRYVILPQAIRNVLPALVNNFVFLLKDTSLASVVAVPEISYLTRQYSSNRFRYPEGLLILAFIYANLTILLSMAAYYLERRLQADKRED
ncbi:MAG: amino acid ABC transporter permease [Chloroflexi bacterium]|nr:amino acid ABC transporter permease [Chloroflexota bacterium]